MVLVGALFLTSCGDDFPPASVTPPLPDPSCQGLYGAPNENTGLSTDVCSARIEGSETWTPRIWDASALAELRDWELENPPPVLTEDPYLATPGLQPDEDFVCAMIVTGEREYRVETFDSVGAAESSGGIVTHGLGCGACSSLEDLAAYAETPDQTEPARECALENLGGPVDELDACIQAAVGFTPSCARIWAYEAINDARECLGECLEALGLPYNEPDGSVNPCLQCVDDKSGSVFRTVAGRTRRTAGIAAGICRPCQAIWRVDHRYPPIR